MKTSFDGMMAIIAHEAIVLETYKDAVGVLTIGVGHTAAAGGLVPVKGLKISVKQALQLFVQDLRKFEARVEKAIRGALKQHEFDGFVSFDFNTGKINGGTVDDKWNKADHAGAMRTLKAYSKGGGKVLKGLQARREDEAAMIMEAIYPPVSKIRIDTVYGKPVKWPAATIRAMLAEVLAEELDQKPRADVPVEASGEEDGSIVVPPSSAPGAGAAGGAVVVGGGAAAAVAAGWPWERVQLGAGIAVALAVIVFIVVKLRKQS